MTAPILLTSFAPWRAHQESNSSDDLILSLMHRGNLPKEVVLMRHLPVHYQLAPCQVIAKAMEIRPAVIVCCGMAETRSLLTVERYAHRDTQILETPLDLPQLVAGTRCTDISHHAGRYVCNHLYYQILKFAQAEASWDIHSLFIHVPVLGLSTHPWIVEDFQHILKKLQALKTGANLAHVA
jgi:pyroglutamyl-peptidase